MGWLWCDYGDCLMSHKSVQISNSKSARFALVINDDTAKTLVMPLAPLPHEDLKNWSRLELLEASVKLTNKMRDVIADLKAQQGDQGGQLAHFDMLEEQVQALFTELGLRLEP